MGVAPERVGHVVLKVRSIERSLPFYTDVLGFSQSARWGPMVFLTATGENHHDLALMEVGDAAENPHARSIGMLHVAIRVASLDALLEAYRDLRGRGFPVGASDHGVSKSISVEDPDGIEIELYADEPPATYGGDVAAAMTVRPWLPGSLDPPKMGETE